MSDFIPDEKDWGDCKDDLDQKFARDLYLGKSNEEMLERFLSGPIEVASELQFMPRIPFQYYMAGFRDSVLSLKHHELDISTSASSFLNLVLYKLKNERDDILPIMDSLKMAINYIAKNQEKYDADVDIYGDFNEVKAEIEGLLLEKKPGSDLKK